MFGESFNAAEAEKEIPVLSTNNQEIREHWSKGTRSNLALHNPY
jgi:hypothetical protein